MWIGSADDPIRIGSSLILLFVAHSDGELPRAALPRYHQTWRAKRAVHFAGLRYCPLIRSSSEFSSAPNRMTIKPSQTHIMNPISEPSEP